jgi:hypothetical protein
MSEAHDEEEKYVDEVTKAIGRALAYTANEPILLIKLEKFFRPAPAKLASTEEESEGLNQRIGRLCQSLGGPPQLIITKENEPLDIYDTYASAAFKEILHSFHRCRRSICRTQVCLIGSELHKSHPDFLEPKPDDPEVLKQMQEMTSEMFWEHAETSYIRLASFWDRVGQLLDFVFFNIRQYERDGFPSVLTRIRSNYVRQFSNIEKSDSWTYLWDYGKSEQPDGFGWLVSRRNLLVHSIHLQALVADKESELYKSAFNHLDETARKKLKPETPASELDSLHTHLDAASVLFPAVLGLCELGVNTKESQKWRVF